MQKSLIVVFFIVCSFLFGDIQKDFVDAVKKGDLSKVKALYSKGISLNARDDIWNTPIVYAEDLDIMDFLIAKGADLKTKYIAGKNIIIKHLERNSSDKLIKKLVSHGADVRVLDKDDRSVVYYAAVKKRDFLIPFFLEHGAAVDSLYNDRSVFSYVDKRDVWDILYKYKKELSNDKILYDAIVFKKYDLVNFIVDKGVSLNKVDSLGFKPICFAFDQKMVDLLLAKGSDLKLKNSYGQNLLHKAVIKNNYVLAKYLVDNNFPIMKKDRYGNTALDYAEKIKSKKLIELLDKDKKSKKK